MITRAINNHSMTLDHVIYLETNHLMMCCQYTNRNNGGTRDAQAAPNRAYIYRINILNVLQQEVGPILIICLLALERHCDFRVNVNCLPINALRTPAKPRKESVSNNWRCHRSQSRQLWYGMPHPTTFASAAVPPSLGQSARRTQINTSYNQITDLYETPAKRPHQNGRVWICDHFQMLRFR
jgi:hypothetical protein